MKIEFRIFGKNVFSTKNIKKDDFVIFPHCLDNNKINHISFEKEKIVVTLQKKCKVEKIKGGDIWLRNI